ncbi:MAG TPA: hypothetical protein VF652_01345 [Allosphingosinicella sp.]
MAIRAALPQAVAMECPDTGRRLGRWPRMIGRTLFIGTLALLAACAPRQETPVREGAGSPAASGAPAKAAAGRDANEAAVLGAAARLPLDQLEAMFRAAIAQTRPFAPQKAVCFGIDEPDRTLGDPPEALRQKLARELGLPGFPASQCAFDIYPYVAASRDQAMLYTVRVMEKSGDGVRFLAVATYGNLGASGEEFRLVRRSGGWVCEPTGLRVQS